MAKFESTIKHSPYEVSKVYAKLSDLNNLSVIREKFNDPTTLGNHKAAVGNYDLRCRFNKHERVSYRQSLRQGSRARAREVHKVPV